jgi:tRNA-dependent cyclodipeptide synthase
MKAKYLNTTKKEVSSKRFNVFIGISLGNTFFSRKNMGEYILWAVENSREDVVVLIADDIHSINYKVLNGLGEKEALEKARLLGKEKEGMVKGIVSCLGLGDKVRVLHWGDILSKEYVRKVGLTFKEFKENKDFKSKILKIGEDFIEGRKLDLNKLERIRLAEYILNELPLLIEGLCFDGKNYEVLPYPVSDSLDDFLLDIQKGDLFEDYLKKLNISFLRKVVVLK